MLSRVEVEQEIRKSMPGTYDCQPADIRRP